ncbi:iron chelate uptake ABC transporter family permease subunit [Fervidibacillus halotolerans]|uniref:Iron chelate uptake ABC transporter family permease subunit n=1 Tax=Fervidibacillus halotolerans TaxID=2980027 RepID=A0A9E8RYL1_9BACI|nr:iron chelate uptake ABC transporter family permease subunit [Fervidibacillus halotolerans]WAA12946.1 iron chelate uptake ABC transporter family permease subunit [Fervidibacillus halotolerans]
MNYKQKTWILAGISILLVMAFLFTDIDFGGNWEYILSRRINKILAIVLTGASIAFSTVVFQTITQNRILTPNIMVLDSLYVLINTLIIFLFGSMTLLTMDQNVQFLMIVVIMVLFSLLLYKFLFKGNNNSIYFLLLVGFIFGTFFDSFSSFMQVLIDPNEFLIVQDRMFASFNNINTDVLSIATVLIIAVSVYFARLMKYLDVLSLGKDTAVNLGVNFDYVVKRLLIVVSILISISTALVGPITFLGLLVANLSYVFMKTYRHQYLILGAVFISIIALVGGQLIVERIFHFSTTLSVIINFVGGIYFIYLLLKENKKW